MSYCRRDMHVEADRRQDTADPQCLDSHSIRTVSGMFQNMSTSTLSPLVSLSNIASFVVERCAVHQQPIYGRWNYHGAVFQPQQRPTVPVSVSRFVTILRVSLPCVSLSSFSIYQNPGAGLPGFRTLTVPKAHTPRHPHGRSVIITLW